MTEETENLPAKRGKYKPKAHYLTIGESKISYNQFRAFELYVNNNCNLGIVEKETGYSRSALYKFTRTEWWAELMKAYVQPHQDNLYTGLAAQADEMLKASRLILTGRFPKGQNANAAVKMIDTFSRMGIRRGNTRIDPLIHNIKEVWTTEEEEQKKAVVNITLVKNIIIEKATEEEARDWAMSGNIPERLKPFLDKQMESMRERAEDAACIDEEIDEFDELRQD